MSTEYCSKCEIEIRSCDEKHYEDDEVFCSEECRDLFKKDGRIGLSEEQEKELVNKLIKLPQSELIAIIVQRMPYRTALDLIQELTTVDSIWFRGKQSLVKAPK